MNATKTAGGLSVDDFLEREAGGVHHVAVVLAELGSAVETARLEWEYDESPEAVRLVRLCAPLDAFLKDLSVDPSDGTLTRWRECRRCSGRGKWGDKGHGEDPCVECGGVGAIHADEADG